MLALSGCARAALLATVALSALSLAAPAQAQQAVVASGAAITGVVTNRAGNFLEAAQVSIPSLGVSTTTDRSGAFRFEGVAPGSYEVQVRYAGLPVSAQSVTIGADGAAAPLRFSLGAVQAATVVVRAAPIAESQAAALQVQRTSASLVSVLSADAAGNFPDQNIAAAIGRLPGVAVERDQGQSRYINLRGARINWTTLSFDGLSVVSPEGRATRFDNIPTAIASQTVVEKAVTPNMPGETVAGNVNIRTRTAFDYPGRKITGKLGLGYVQLGGGEEADAAIVISDRFQIGRAHV